MSNSPRHKHNKKCLKRGHVNIVSSIQGSSESDPYFHYTTSQTNHYTYLCTRCGVYSSEAKTRYRELIPKWTEWEIE